VADQNGDVDPAGTEKTTEPVLGLAHPGEHTAGQPGGGMSTRRRLEFAGAAAALALGAGWLLLPPSDSPDKADAAPAANMAYASPPSLPGDHDHASLPRGYRGKPLPPPLELSSPEPTPTAKGPAVQYLATMRVFAGPKNVRPAANARGESVEMPCATGRGSDLFREVRYHLRRDYGTFSTRVINRGDSAATSTVRVLILGGDGTLLDRTLAPGKGAEVNVSVKDSEYLRIRTFCGSPKSSAEFEDALLVR
jgi:hypothetical protein